MSWAMRKGKKMAISERELSQAGTRNIDDIADKVFAGERLTAEDGLRLFAHPNVPELGFLANHLRARLHPEPNPLVTYVAGRNVNYTNVCWARCKFCAFYRVTRAAQGYTLSREH